MIVYMTCKNCEKGYDVVILNNKIYSINSYLVKSNSKNRQNVIFNKSKNCTNEFILIRKC